ncbi:MAG TPA: tRNA pseudouridine(13) synthase TruD [Polyangiaceae bacterium]|nr:tRNA pseudouridine(13) synthase TruD [Polyangiaceae bacterium]
MTPQADANDMPPGRIKDAPEDFVVEEIPAYAPSGAGEHVFIRLTKRDRTTPDAVRDVARALGCDPREAGYAGMKDKRAVTTQTISLHAPRGTKPDDLAAQALSVAVPGVTIHEAAPHGNKLKPGHLLGNRFTIAVRGVPRERAAEVTASLDRVAREGVPNAFGEQRFGAAGDNADRALAWLRGQDRGPRDKTLLRLLWSSLQSAIFNAVLDARVKDGTWTTPLAGDLLKLRTSGGLFVCSDVQTDRERAMTGEVSPTGPIVGVSMRTAEGAPAELEKRVTDSILGEGIDLTKTRALGEGSRRSLRLWIEGLRVIPDEPNESGNRTSCLRVHFVLPKGAYATTVLASAIAMNAPESN